MVKDDPDDPIPLSHATPAPERGDIELPVRQQRWNSFVFLLSHAVSYFVAPVFYVGVLHAAIIRTLGFSDTTANLPETVFVYMLPLPVLITWFLPSTRYLRPILVSSFLLKGMAGVAVAALFLLHARPVMLVSGLVLHATIIGAMNGVSNMCLWELICRGTDPARRKWTLALTFGIGPIFAVLGSCLSQLVLSGNFVDLIRLGPIPRPWSYVALFASTGPVMIVAGAGVIFARVSRSSADEPRASIAGIKAGLRDYFGNPLIVLAGIGFLMTAAGGMIFPNLALFVRDAMGQLPEKFSGLQMMIRFGVKSIFGFGLGWLLAKTNPKVPAVTTTLVSLAGVVWALVVPGKWYMFSFGLLGAGELYYIYYLNYIVGCSAPHRVRENTAYTNVLLALIGFMAVLYGRTSDQYGLKASFMLAGAVLLATLVAMCVLLPRRPALGVVAEPG
jgi:hypothetical protein